MTTTSLRAADAFCALVVFFASAAGVSPASAQRLNLLPNGGVESGASPAGPLGWTRQVFEPGASLTWDVDAAHDEVHSLKISATHPNDTAWVQTISLEPETNYLLSGWIKTENVEHTTQAVDAGANLCLYGTWERTAAVTGTTDWTEVRMSFNSGSTGTVTIGARLGFWSGVTSGTAWFDDMRVTEIRPTDPRPRWKLLVLVYDTTDVTYVDGVTTRHVIGHIGDAQVGAAAAAATKFVQTDIPALTSGNMVPDLTIRYPGTLAHLSPHSGGWWPSPDDTASDRDPAFDSVIVIWQPTVTDQHTGQQLWIGSAAGLTPAMGTAQTYTTLIIEAATLYGHLNVFKHEWGHSILSYFDAARTTPKPTVNNHAESVTYVNCQTGQYYVWVDETDANRIPNSIYHNGSGFTHDYYSGTTALATNPTNCLGITASAWATDGPVSKSIADSTPASDTIPPTTTASLAPLPNAAGWNNSDVSVGLTSVDNDGGSGVRQVSYLVARAPPGPITTVPGHTAVVTIAAEGVSTLTFSATDNAGNAEPVNTVVVKLDKTPPTVTSTRSPASNANGWNNTPVTVEIQCTDARSGIPSGGSPAPVIISTEGADQSIVGRCTDLAGNSTTSTVQGISIDLTPPALEVPGARVIPQTTPAGAIVTYDFPTLMETGSGVVSKGCVPMSGSTFPVGLTTVTCTASDRAGNTGSTHFSVTVTATSPRQGRMMVGAGFILHRDKHHHFVFHVARVENQEYGRFEYWVNDPNGCTSDEDRRDAFSPGRDHDRDDRRNHRGPTNRFEATSFNSVVFADDSGATSHRWSRPTIDAVHFSGIGNWNGRPGYTFEVEATAGGASLPARGAFSLVVKDPRRRVIAQVAGPLDGGQIHSTHRSR